MTTPALDLRLVNSSFTIGDSAWCSEVTRQSVVRIRARLQGQAVARQ